MDTKLTLTVMVQGAKLLSEEVCQSDPENNYDTHKLVLDVKYWDKKTKKNYWKKEPVFFKTRKNQLVAQTINISNDAYLSFMNPDNCPSWCSFKEWRRLQPDQRLEAHMQRLSDSLGGVSYSYTVYKD